MNVFKMLLGGAKIEWENRYVEIRNQKVFLYAGQNYSKPLEVLELTSDLKIREIRRAESNGKAHVFEICCNKEQLQNTTRQDCGLIPVVVINEMVKVTSKPE